MLKTLDILIGATTVVLIFSMAVTVITQAVTSFFGRRGRNLKAGLSDLLQQLGIPERAVTDKIAHAVLAHPLLSEGKFFWGKTKLGTVVSREEFTKILLDAAASLQPSAPTPGGSVTSGATPPSAAVSTNNMWSHLEVGAMEKLYAMLQANGINDPAGTLRNVRAMALQLEASNPELANDVRQSLALIHEASSDYVARVNAWFDQTMDRVSQRFTKYTHYVTLCIAALVVLAVQLDMIAVVDRLSVDDNFRKTMVDSAAADFAKPPSGSSTKPTQSAGTSVSGSSTNTPSTASPPASNPPAQGSQPGQNLNAGANAATGATNTASTNANPSSTAGAATPEAPPGGGSSQNTQPANVPQINDADKYYNLLSSAGLVTLPLGYNWVEQMAWRKVPGMLIAMLLVSLGAPFWYNILKDLLGLRSSLAKNEDAQRMIRQTTQDASSTVTAITTDIAAVAPAWLKSEVGNLKALG